MKYRCFRCNNYETNIKTRYIRHLKRKNPCKRVNDIEVATLLTEIQNKSYINRFENDEISENSLKNPEKYTKLNHFESQMSTYCQPNVNIMSTSCQPNVNIMSSSCQHVSTSVNQNVNIKEYTCKHCNKKYKYRQSKSRHEKTCKHRFDAGCPIINLNELSEKNYIESLQKQIEKLCKEKEQMRKKMREEKEEILKEKEEMAKQLEQLWDKVGNINNYQININSYGK